MPTSSFFSFVPSIPIPSFASLVPLYESYLKLRFTHYLGLSSRVVDVSPSASLHFWSAESPGRTPRDRPVLVLLHGFGPTASALHQFPVGLLRDLSERFCLVIPDLQFFHPGSTTRSSDRSESSQASAVIGLLDAICVERFHVLGTSYGGFVACRVASMCGTERVKKVVIASSGVNMRRRNNEELARKAGVEHVEEVLMPETPARLRRLLELAIWNPRVSHMLPDLALGDVINKMYLPNRKEKLELLKGLTLGRDDNPNITPLEQDVLLIWGEEDQLFPLEMALELKEILGKKVQLEVIRKTSHVPQIEHPKKFGKLVIDFLCGSDENPSNSQRVRL